MRPISIEPPSPRKQPPLTEGSGAACAGHCGECGLSGEEAAESQVDESWSNARHLTALMAVFLLPLVTAAAGAFLGATPSGQLLGGLVGLVAGVAAARIVTRLITPKPSED